MTGGWAALNTLREAIPFRSGCGCKNCTETWPAALRAVREGQ